MDIFEKLSLLEDDWNSYGAPPPNNLAIYRTRGFVQQLKLYNLPHANIAPLAEGGVCVSFGSNKYMGDLDFFNDGDVTQTVMFGEEVVVDLIWDKNIENSASSFYAYQKMIWVAIQYMKIVNEGK